MSATIDPEDFGYLKATINSIAENTAEIKEHLKTQNGRIGKVEVEQGEMRGSISTWKWIAGCGGLVGIIALLIGLFLK